MLYLLDTSVAMSLRSRKKLWNFFENLFVNELSSSSTRHSSPEWIKTELLPHQQAAYQSCLNLESAKEKGMHVNGIVGESTGGLFFTSHGILGDNVGTGKSLIALSLVKESPPSNNYTEFILRAGIMGDGRDTGLLRTRSQLITSLTQLELTPTNTALFIVPHALIGQWETYVNRDTNLRVKFIKRRQEATDVTFMNTFNSYDAIIVSATMYNTLKICHPISSILWSRLFIDEADSIQISTTNDELNACFYWFISASWLNMVFANGAFFNLTTTYPPLPDTPVDVVNAVYKRVLNSNNLTIHGIRHMNIVKRMCCGLGRDCPYAINPATLQASRLIIRSSDAFMDESFCMPNIFHTTLRCATPRNIQLLNDLISSDMLERLNAGDVHGAIDMLGMTTYSHTEISEAVTSSLIKDLENAKHTLTYKQSLEYSTPALKVKAIETCEQKIASIESRIQAIQDRLKAATEQNCPICFCDVSNPSVTPCCQQVFCFPCLCESLKHVAACPLCRARIYDIKTVKVMGAAKSSGATSDSVETSPLKPVDKRSTFLNYVDTHRDAKILMFSSYDASFDLLTERMKSMGLTFAIVSGSQSRIQKLLRDFKDGKYNVLFLNARNMGSGLNIEFASHVILYHKMTTELENQIIGRAMRLGRKEDLQVVHLLHQNEIQTERVITHV